MVTVISPAKSLDFETPACTLQATSPLFRDRSEVLIDKLRGYSVRRLMGLMDISQNLAELNVQRYLEWGSEPSLAKRKQAVLAFDGDVYQGLEATHLQEADFEFAQDHLRILSGLYGVLRPLDMIEPHRLEMGTHLKTARRKNLYEFWGNAITDHLNAAAEASGSNWLLNLASQEYFGAVQLPGLKAGLVTPVFLDKKGADYKVVSFWAKIARGKMTAWIIANGINHPAALKDAQIWGYRYDSTHSTDQQWAFVRDTPMSR